MLFVAASLSSSVLCGVEIAVSPRGKISTLPAARDAARALRAAGQKSDIDVVIANGTYVLEETFILGLADSAPAGAVTRYCAAVGARPVISGGRVIANWKRSDLAGGNIWVADVPWAKGVAFFHALFDGGELLQRAKSAEIMIRPFKCPSRQKRKFVAILTFSLSRG